MRDRAALLAAFVWLSAAGTAAAQPAVVAAQAFVSSGGFFPVTPANALQGVPQADGAVSPAELAVLVLERREVASVWRARWVIRVTRRQIGGDVVDLTEVERFNLGPATRVQYLRTRPTAPPVEIFGVGAHVAWRLVSRPDGPSHTVLLNVGRRDYPEFEAKDRDCGGTLCTSLQAPMESRAEWAKVKDGTALAAPSPFPAIVTRTDGQVEFEDESIPHVVRALSELSGLAPGSGTTWAGPAPDSPMLLLVDSNIGEEGGSDAAVGPGVEGGRWFRRTSVVAVAPELTVRVFEGSIRLR